VGHVTNYARNEDTWVWGLEQLQQQLGLQQWQQLWQTMQQSTALTAAAVLGPLRAAHKWLQPSIANYGFQMLGLDYLVDEQLHPWLLEVNSAPSIMAVHSCPKTCQLIKKTKQAMLADMLAMVQHRVGPAAAAAAAAAEGGAGPDRKAGGWQSVPWREEFAAEMTSRGGFEPLMHLFPFHQRSIPWHESDLQLQQLLDKQQQQHVTRRP
jgi:tubulin polyglutamylase TTLL6/13